MDYIEIIEDNSAQNASANQGMANTAMSAMGIPYSQTRTWQSAAPYCLARPPRRARSSGNNRVGFARARAK